jgi:hypothetical protein
MDETHYKFTEIAQASVDSAHKAFAGMCSAPPPHDISEVCNLCEVRKYKAGQINNVEVVSILENS